MNTCKKNDSEITLNNINDYEINYSEVNLI